MKIDPELIRGILTGHHRESKEKLLVSDLLHRVPPLPGGTRASQTTVEFLADLPLFRGLTNKEVSQLASLLHERRFGDGEIIFEQGSPSGAFYLVRDGSVELFRTRDGRERMLATLGPNDYLGEMALLLDEAPRHISARSRGPSELLAFSRSDFETLAARSPVLSVKLLRALGRLVAERFRMLVEAVEGGSSE